MRVSMQDHKGVRDQVHAGISALRVQARQVWGPNKHTLDEIVVRLMVGVGDLARAARDGGFNDTGEWNGVRPEDVDRGLEIKKELGNIILSTVRWIDDLGLDPLECLDLAIMAQEEFAKSGRAR